MVKEKATTKIEEETKIASYYMAGQKIPVPDFSWNVYDSYEIVELEEYFKRYKTNKLDFYKNERILEYLNTLESTKIIIPTYEKGYKQYKPLDNMPNLAARLAQLNKLDERDNSGQKYLSDDDIIGWISKFGLLSDKPLSCCQGEYIRHFVEEDSSIPLRLETLGRLLYFEELLMFYTPQVSSHYAMLRDTFIQLQEFTSDIFYAYIAFKEKRLDQSKEILGNMMPNHLIEILLDEGSQEYERQINKGNKEDKEDKEVDTAKEILAFLSTAISINLSGICMNLIFEKKQDTYIAVQNWIVRDLWSAIMLQFYDYIACHQEFRRCPACKCYFSTKDVPPNREYCPEGTGKYSNCKEVARDVRRKKKPKVPKVSKDKLVP